MSNYSIKLRQERREELALRALTFADDERANSGSDEEASELNTSYTYEVELEDTEFGFLPPFMKAGMIKGLKKKLDAESDPDKKAEIQAKIDKLNSNKKEEMAARVASFLDKGSDVELGIGKSLSKALNKVTSKFNEKQHPRADNGKFAKGSGGSSKSASAPTSEYGPGMDRWQSDKEVIQGEIVDAMKGFDGVKDENGKDVLLLPPSERTKYPKYVEANAKLQAAQKKLTEHEKKIPGGVKADPKGDKWDTKRNELDDELWKHVYEQRDILKKNGNNESDPKYKAASAKKDTAQKALDEHLDLGIEGYDRKHQSQKGFKPASKSTPKPSHSSQRKPFIT